jgi:hypothetical protein
LLLLSEGQAANVSKLSNKTAFYRKSGGFGKKSALWIALVTQGTATTASTSLLLRSNVLHVRKGRHSDPLCAVSLKRS